MAASPEGVLFTLAAVILFGFIGQLFFRATRISDILLLMAGGAGLALLVRTTDAADTSAFPALAPVVGLFALLIILFEGGLDLRFGELLRGLARATVLAVLSFGLTVALIAAAGAYLLDIEPLKAAMLGAILGGSSSIAVMPVVKRLNVSEGTRVLLSVESAVTDVLCVVGALTIAGILVARGEPDLAGTGRGVFSGFVVAIVVGAAVGVLWLKVLDAPVLEGARYMLTVAVVLGTHVLVDVVLHANGPVAVLVVGIVLGNHRALKRMLRLHVEEVTKAVRAFQGEVAFVTRAFFFVYLGFLMDPDQLGWPALRVGLVLLAAISVARFVATWVASVGSAELRPDLAVQFTMMPRGLAAAVLAGVPSLTYDIEGTEQFVAYAAITIILTNAVAAMAGVVGSRMPGMPPASRARGTGIDKVDEMPPKVSRRGARRPGKPSSGEGRTRARDGTATRDP